VRWTIRPAEARDAAEIAEMFGRFARGHPSENVVRPPEAILRHYLGPNPMGQLLVAEVSGQPIGLGVWRMAYDYFWNLEHGEVTGLYVEPEYRGLGVAVGLIAAICAAVRASGGEYIMGHYSGDPQTGLYERVAAGHPGRIGYVSARAFHRMANLAGAGGRELATKLPDPAWNRDDAGIAQENAGATSGTNRS
jgi:GNAT superfamily N-acetyltransferase